MNPNTLDDWLAYINTQHTAEIVMGLDRVRAVWARLGHPKAPANVVVAGTNGKGSTCAMMVSALHAAGYRTGFYSSPHLIKFNERIRVAGADADDAVIVGALAAVEKARLESEAIPLTYFEFATLAALVVFAEAALDVAVLEVGMGGRLDAVNLIDADVSIITSVDLDHQLFLGDTREKIGWEKAHVYRPDRLAIYADPDMPASVAAHAEAIGARLHVLGRDYRFERQEQQWQWQGSILGRQATRHALPYPALRGGYQLRNAAAAIAALTGLADRLPVSQSHLKRGLLEVEWPGRMQVLPGRPTVVLDVAHNPHAARALDDALGGMGFHENTYAVFAMLKDKDIGEVVRLLAHRIDHWHIAGLPGPRGATAGEIAQLLDQAGLNGHHTAHLDVASAYAAARARATPNDRILGFGSFLTVAALMEATERDR